jgi:hypothetical protein
VRLRFCPVQSVVLPEGVGTEGTGFTVTETVPAVLTQVPALAVTEYMPVAAVPAEVIAGFCDEEEKPFGPVQE